ncbi:hypothetical protein PGH26_08310 [Sporosarcina jeotgali]|uniref:Uncharacterized protein n=1 Tax=Sporosarcina jeotgali TaxID=3020056 RepID=A0ABZ0KS35_9BACL|nr:hypothetical protein [Sporosarcina sp. B2O-1]WOV82945.1 hypothetical protein PGH26_08310 [Sporosarcina sp. B2O-1]
MASLIYTSLTIAVIAGIVFVVFKIKKTTSNLTLYLFISTVIATLAALAYQMMSLWHALLVILGLSFATAVLLAKRQEA